MKTKLVCISIIIVFSVSLFTGIYIYLQGKKTEVIEEFIYNEAKKAVKDTNKTNKRLDCAETQNLTDEQYEKLCLK